MTFFSWSSLHLSPGNVPVSLPRSLNWPDNLFNSAGSSYSKEQIRISLCKRKHDEKCSGYSLPCTAQQILIVLTSPVLRGCRDWAVPSHYPATLVPQERCEIKGGNLPTQPVQTVVLTSYTKQDSDVCFLACAEVFVLSISSARVCFAKGNTQMQRKADPKSVTCHLSGQEIQENSYPILQWPREDPSSPVEGVVSPHGL